MATLYKLTATQTRGEIPKGFTFQVASRNTPSPHQDDVKRAILAAGFSEDTARRYCSAGNFKVERL